MTLFDTSDRNIVLRAEALNSLEAFTYRARDYLEDETFVAASSEQERKELEEQLSHTSEWLYGDGADAKLQDGSGCAAERCEGRKRNDFLDTSIERGRPHDVCEFPVQCARSKGGGYR